MTLERLRNAFSFGRQDAATKQHSRRADTALAMRRLSARDPGSWSSAHEDFTCLRFFVWTGGDPGFTLTTKVDDKEHVLACDEDAELRVDRITAQKVWEAGIRPGDVLETVASKRVHTMDTEAAIVLVQMSKSPSIIRFRSPTTGKRVRYDVLLGHQKLGLFFTPDSGNAVPVVTRLPHRRGLGDPSSHGVRLGDILVAVNGMDAVAAGFGRTMEFVETCPRPLRLTFERAVNDDADGQWFGSQVASEQSGEQRRGSISLRDAIPNLRATGMRTRALASLRCKEFVRSLMPSGGNSAQSRLQLEAGDHSGGRSAEPPADADTQHGVLIEWNSGPLGLTLLEDPISGASLVNRLTGKGSSANMERLQHGYQLYSINGVRTEGRALDALCHDLVTLPKPIKIVFRPPHLDDTSEDGSRSEHSSNSSSSSSSPQTRAQSETELDADNHRALVRRASMVEHCSPHQSSLIREHHEYEVIWTANQLGLELEIPHINNTAPTPMRGQYPIVHKVLKKSTLDLPSDAVGHLFVAINNWSTSGLTTTELRTLLRVAEKPAVLRFRRRDDPSGFQRTFLSNSSHNVEEAGMGGRHSTFGSAYNILWSEGELGITFGCYEDADRRHALIVYVKRIGPGQAQDSRLVSIGDLLCSINGQELPPKQKFKKTMSKLVNTRQPVTLGFRRLLVERCSDWNREGHS
ncbi:hypothetical protein PF008_g16320 [Phytophthora fragariae]|uniref:PDZ domain-containing protein n=2 Tax=Phytophthora fragariae TaxID=53985 RepID=A0A6G0RBH9_9STRA|nr:hypothetical protein PF008_g16320 [Phytophthora fragariae]